MSYPEPKAKYPGQDRATKMAGRVEGGGVSETPTQKYVNDALARGAVKVARGLNAIGLGNAGSRSVQQNDDMVQANKISDEVPRRGIDMEKP